MKKIPKDIQLQVDKGNFVIAIKELSKKENISLDEAKLWIDAYEDAKNKPKNSSNPLLNSAEKDINAQTKSSIPFVWIKRLTILLMSVGLSVLVFQLL